MIRVKTEHKRIRVTGHAEYDDYGKDIVCASASSIVTTSINAILMFDKNAIKYTTSEGLIEIEVLTMDHVTKKILENMLNMLEQLSRDYPKNIKVERE